MFTINGSQLGMCEAITAEGIRSFLSSISEDMVLKLLVPRDGAAGPGAAAAADASVPDVAPSCS